MVDGALVWRVWPWNDVSMKSLSDNIINSSTSIKVVKKYIIITFLL